MTLGNDTIASWMIRRNGIITAAVLIALNVSAITVTAIIQNDESSRGNPNIFSLSTQWIDLLVLVVSALLLLAAALASLSLTMRPWARALLPWIGTLVIVAGVGYWILHVL